MLAKLQQLSLPDFSALSLNDNAQTNAGVTFDRSFVILVVTLYIIGLVMVASSSMPVADRLFNNPFHFYYPSYDLYRFKLSYRRFSITNSDELVA